MTLEFEKTASVTVQQLPSLMLPSDSAAVEKLAQMLCLLEQWIALENPTPFTLSDLVTHSPLAQEAPTFMKTALGDKWGEWFAVNAPDNTIVPKQVAGLLLATLKRLSETWEQSQEQEAIRAQAAGSYAALVGHAKKRRASLLDSEMVPAVANIA